MNNSLSKPYQNQFFLTWKRGLDINDVKKEIPHMANEDLQNDNTIVRIALFWGNCIKYKKVAEIFSDEAKPRYIFAIDWDSDICNLLGNMVEDKIAQFEATSQKRDFYNFKIMMHEITEAINNEIDLINLEEAKKNLQ